ncbi:MAG: hypothetical protein ACOYNL_07875, partial [Rickettsiales bacterium]
MAPNYSSLHEQLLKKILSSVPKSASKKTLAFVNAFYALSTVNALEELTPKRAAEIALACEKFIARRAGTTPKINIEKARITEGKRTAVRTQISVLNDDMPFLVDSLSALFTSLGLTIHLIQHPIFDVTRDARGILATGKKPTAESLIYMELSPLPAEVTEEILTAHILRTLDHVATAVRDWIPMNKRVLALAEQAGNLAPIIRKSEAEEIRDLL